MRSNVFLMAFASATCRSRAAYRQHQKERILSQLVFHIHCVFHGAVVILGDLAKPEALIQCLRVFEKIQSVEQHPFRTRPSLPRQVSARTYIGQVPSPGIRGAHPTRRCSQERSSCRFMPTQPAGAPSGKRIRSAVRLAVFVSEVRKLIVVVL